jgi:acyl transferase domain-containing protein
MAGRFPDAASVDEFWRNLRNGVESIRTFTDEELIAAGIPASVLEDSHCVRRGTVVPDFDCFDAQFFGFTPRDAEVTDPQQRVFLEVAWESLEHSGYAPREYPGAIGVFAGSSTSDYFIRKILGNARVAASVSPMQIKIGNEKDFLSTRVAYHFGLRGPAVTVQTACSTSLVAVHLACQSLLNGESDIALAGGACLLTRPMGYLYQPGGNLSSDGRCRAFDEKASGTTPGTGVAVVVLKSLARALQDGDTIHAVIRGSAINNDASDKVGFAAPSVNGQAAVITEAMAVSDVEPESISYVEAHGTGTILGDPIEIKALQQAFATSTDKKQFCAIGSVKTNVGHLDVAAGVTGLIKAVLTVREREIAPSLHFSRANPHINFPDSPFYVNTSLQHVSPAITPLRAGVSSFGIGGTNAHAIVEEPPRITSAPSPRSWHVILLSAKTPEALSSAGARLERFLTERPQISLADAAYTSQIGRTAFPHRRALVCNSISDAVRQLAADGVEAGRAEEGKAASIVFMFPGQGAQYPGMGRELYRSEEIFRTEVDRCSELLRAELGFDLRTVLLAEDESSAATQHLLRQTDIAQPALFTIEYALARQLEHWGVRPDAMVGHSLGEYVAACLAGVFSLQDALTLLARRGKLIASLPTGRMLAVHASEQSLQPLIERGTWIAAVNAASLCSVSGTCEAIEALEGVLRARGFEFQRLHTSHAFHSGMMDPILNDFAAAVSSVRRNAPRIAFVSNVSGTWITAEQATSSSYWCEHLRQSVQFSQAVQGLMQMHAPLFVEVGPGRALVSMVRAHARTGVPLRTTTVLPVGSSGFTSTATVLRAASWLWTQGVHVDWARLHGRERRRRIPLPCYPFARQRYWVEDQDLPAVAAANRARADVGTWLYAPTWKRSAAARPGATQTIASGSLHLVIADPNGLSQPIIDAIRARGERVIVATRGNDFACAGDGRFEIDVRQLTHFERLLSLVIEQRGTLCKITNCLTLTSPRSRQAVDPYEGFYSMRLLAQAIGALNLDAELAVNVVSNGLFAVLGDELLFPEKATVLGPCKLLPFESRKVRTRCLDIVVGDREIEPELGELVANELASPIGDTVVALRKRYRWTPSIEPVQEQGPAPQPSALSARPHYLITGGLGRVGHAVARYLAENRPGSALTVTGRHSLPPPVDWAEYLRTHAEHDPGSRRIRQLQGLEALGASVLYVATDVTDEQATIRMADHASKAFGLPHGIFHAAAGAADGALHLDAQAEAFRVLAPKVTGATVLRKVFDFSRLDFVVLCASTNALQPLLGQAGAAAADAFLAALAHYESLRGNGHVVCASWARCDAAAGMPDAARPEPFMEDRTGIAAFMSNGVSASDAKVIFDRLLWMGLPEVIVSSGEHPIVAERAANANRSPKNIEQPHSPNALTPVARSASTAPYVPPGNDTEKVLVGIWQNLLGIAPIGVRDNFFELGGHSLMATQVLSQLLKELQVTLPLRSLFEATTVSALAIEVDAARAHAEDVRRETVIAVKGSLQKSIDAMSPQEIASLLDEKKRLNENKPRVA